MLRPWHHSLGRYRYVRWHCLLFAVVDAVGWFAAALSQSWKRKLADPPSSDPRSILLVQLDHLGDAVITTGMLQALRKHYPQAAIEVLCSPWTQELFAACPEVNQVYVSKVNRFSRQDRRGWVWDILRWGWRLRRRRYDLAIDVRGEFPLALLIWLTGARRRLGWNCGGGGFLLTDSPAYVPGRPETESRQALLNLLGVAPPEPLGAWRPAFDPGEESRQWIDRELARLDRQSNQVLARVALPQAHLPALVRSTAVGHRPLIVLHIGSGMDAKRWPVQHWRELLGRLIVEHDARVILVGTAP